MFSAVLLLAGAPACGQAGGSASRAEASAAFVASSRGTVYYWIGCDNWRSIPAANLRWFDTVSAAEAAGYRPSTARGCEAPDRRAGPTPVETMECTVERVVDGDTVACVEAATRIRLLLVDAPELGQSEYGERARRHLETMLPPGTIARVELDREHRDSFGRVLAYLYVARDEMVNEALARAGYAVAGSYPPNVKHFDRIVAAADEARRERRGLWRDGAFDCLPADYRANLCR